MVSNQKHRRIANYREQLSVLWQFGCLSLSIHKIKKSIIVQNVNQRPYVYLKWTLKSSFCFHTKDRKSNVSTIQFIVFFILYFYILVTEHSRFLIHTQLFTSYWIHLIPLHYFIHARTRLLYSLTWQHIALFFNYNKGSVSLFCTKFKLNLIHFYKIKFWASRNKDIYMSISSVSLPLSNS